MSAIDVRRIPRRRPGRALPESPGELPDGDGPLPLARPATSDGWAPPYTNTPNEIARRRAELGDAVEERRHRATATRRAADTQWAAAIRDAWNELVGPAPTRADGPETDETRNP